MSKHKYLTERNIQRFGVALCFTGLFYLIPRSNLETTLCADKWGEYYQNNQRFFCEIKSVANLNFWVIEVVAFVILVKSRFFELSRRGDMTGTLKNMPLRSFFSKKK